MADRKTATKEVESFDVEFDEVSKEKLEQAADDKYDDEGHDITRNCPLRPL
jgi:hypothetical protein